jgi:hypothetical protein
MAYRAAIFGAAVQGCPEALSGHRVSAETLLGMRVVIELDLKPDADLTLATGTNAFRLKSAAILNHVQLCDQWPDYIGLIKTLQEREVMAGALGLQVSSLYPLASAEAPSLPL